MALETADLIIREGLESLRKYYSIYRGVVVDNNDTEKRMNRLKVTIPDVMGGITLWALPKGQHGSQNDGFKYLAPKVGDIVWITFEYGDPTKPVWEYHGWGLNQINPLLISPNRMGFVTPEGNILIIDDEDGTLNINFNGDINISTKGSVMINSAQDIMIRSQDSVMVNDGSNQGVVKIKELTEKLNKTIQELEQLRNLFNTHVHPGVQTGPGSSGPTPTQMSTPFSTYVQTDYEDFNFIH